MEFDQNSNDPEITSEELEQGTAKKWLQDNLRIIVSIIIVLLIAGGIYSYSKRTETSIKSEVAGENVEEQQGILSESEEASQEENTAPSQGPDNEKIIAQEEKSPIQISQETENSFVQTAIKGDSQTKLARKALANFLEKNPDSSLTAEHKIYVEDYLRKKVQFNKRVAIGTSIEFQKSLLEEAVAKSKNLNENQLKNLHKYAVRVPSLS